MSLAVLGLACLWGGGVHPEIGLPGCGAVGTFLRGSGDLVEKDAGESVERIHLSEMLFSSSSVPPAPVQTQPHLRAAGSRDPLPWAMHVGTSDPPPGAQGRLF